MGGGKHTPGPWELDGSEILAPNSMSEWGGEPVTVVNLYRGMGGDDTDADARLIAAAPELLEALKLLIAECPDAWSRHRTYAAITKATGERP